MTRQDDWMELLPLLGRRSVVLHAPPTGDEPPELSGGDIDCAVNGLDQQWPLRAINGWRVCQRLHYDLRGWCWVLERGGQVVALDTLDDPLGLGRDAIPTTRLDASSDGIPPAVRAAYLTSKRIRKRMGQEAEWTRIQRLAAHDEAGYLATVREFLGRGTERRIARAVVRGDVPERSDVAISHVLQLLHRVRSPRRLGLALWLGARRIWERVVDPTGLVVVVAGPDGCGKSTVAAALPGTLGPLFRRHTHVHWRPGVLPRPGRLLGRSPGDPAEPHGRPPYGRPTSIFLISYYWADFVIGGWTRLWLERLRTGLVVVERGWSDLIVDPTRYRLAPAPRFVRALGHTVPRADMVLVLDAPESVLANRKDELPVEELTRQRRAWADIAAEHPGGVLLDASAPLELVLDAAREAVADHLERRTARRIGHGWAGLPRRGMARWLVPRGTRRTATSGLDLYLPVTPAGIVGWTIAKGAARAGVLRALPRAAAPEEHVRAAVAGIVPPGGTIAVARLRDAGRRFVAVLDREGTWVAAVKLATDDAGQRALEREAAALAELAPLVTQPLVAPRVLLSEPGILVTEPMVGRPRARPWALPDPVAEAVGRLQRSGVSHGDLTPWNLLVEGDRWALVDWERASRDAEPFADLCHFLFQSHALLGRPSRRAIVDGFSGVGPIGRSVSAYARGAGLDAAGASEAMARYLRRRAGDADLRAHRRAGQAHLRLAAALDP